MSQVQLEAFFLVQNARTAFPSTLVTMLELSPPLPIIPLLRVAGLSKLNTIIVLIRRQKGNKITKDFSSVRLPTLSRKPMIQLEGKYCTIF
jgi:hypothetical protein